MICAWIRDDQSPCLHRCGMLPNGAHRGGDHNTCPKYFLEVVAAWWESDVCC